VTDGAGILSEPRRRVPWRLLAFGVVAVAAFAVGFLTFSVSRSRLLIQHYGYYTIAGTFVWALFAWYGIRGAARAALQPVTRRERWHVVVAILACTLVAVLTLPIDYKILYDEMVLQATAADMHTFREVSTIVRGYTVDGVFVPLDTYLDKRPMFFPFLVSLLHDLTGYRENNAFLLNIALMPVVLAQVYLLVRRFAGHGGAMAAAVALGTLSTLAHSATGAGMETLNLAMLLLVMHLSVLYLDAPDGARLSALVLAAVLLAQTRYESSLYVGPVAVVALEGWRRTGRIIMPMAAILAPALLIPYAIHNTYLSGTPRLWELHENESSRFGLGYLANNLTHAGRYFFNVFDNRTSSLWLSVAGFVGFGYALFRLWRRRREWRSAASAPLVLIVFGAAILGNLGLLMFYYWGQLDDPTVMRLALPFSALLAVCIGFAVDRVRVRWRHMAWYAAGGAVLAYFWSGLVVNEQHTKLNTLEDELQWERRYVAALPPGDRLVLTGKSALPWILQRIPAISIDHARRRVDALRYQLANHTFRELLVFQTYRPTGAEGNFQMEAADRLPDWFVLEPVTERRFGTRIDRVSRLVAINPPEPTTNPPAVGGAAPTAAVKTAKAGK
jgi:hypothetical protein